MTAMGELVLQRRGTHHEIVSNGMFIMSTADGRSERLLARAAIDRSPAGRSVLVGGLGVGYSVAEALEEPRVERVVVVEIQPAVIAWCRAELAWACRHALDDPRVEVVQADLGSWLASSQDRFHAICLDVDNGPDWTLAPGNAWLYGGHGLALLAARLDGRGVLAVWGASPSAPFQRSLRGRFHLVETLEVPVERGPPDVVWVASSPR